MNTLREGSELKQLKSAETVRTVIYPHQHAAWMVLHKLCMVKHQTSGTTSVFQSCCVCMGTGLWVHVNNTQGRPLSYTLCTMTHTEHPNTTVLGDNYQRVRHAGASPQSNSCPHIHAHAQKHTSHVKHVELQFIKGKP